MTKSVFFKRGRKIPLRLGFEGCVGVFKGRPVRHCQDRCAQMLGGVRWHHCSPGDLLPLSWRAALGPRSWSQGPLGTALRNWESILSNGTKNSWHSRSAFSGLSDGSGALVMATPKAASLRGNALLQGFLEPLWSVPSALCTLAPCWGPLVTGDSEGAMPIRGQWQVWRELARAGAQAPVPMGFQLRRVMPHPAGG